MYDYHLGRILGYLTYPSILTIIILSLAAMQLSPWQILSAGFAIEAIGSIGYWLRRRAAIRVLTTALMIKKTGNE